MTEQAIEIIKKRELISIDSFNRHKLIICEALVFNDFAYTHNESTANFFMCDPSFSVMKMEDRTHNGSQRYQIKFIGEKNMDNFVETIVKERKDRVEAVQTAEKARVEKELIETGKTSTLIREIADLFKNRKNFDVVYSKTYDTYSITFVDNLS